MRDKSKQQPPPPQHTKPRPVQPTETTPPTQTELDRQRAADEGMTEAPPGTPSHKSKSIPDR